MLGDRNVIEREIITGLLMKEAEWDKHDFSTSGYQKLPSGLIIQWFPYISSQAARENVPFPVAFPHKLLSVASVTNSSSNPAVQPIISMALSTREYLNIAMAYTTRNEYTAGYSALIVAIGY